MTLANSRHERGDTGHKHMRWDDMNDENVHAVSKAFHFFKDGKIYNLLQFKEKKNPRWNIRCLHYTKKKKKRVCVCIQQEERNKWLDVMEWNGHLEDRHSHEFSVKTKNDFSVKNITQCCPWPFKSSRSFRWDRLQKWITCCCWNKCQHL